MRYAQVLIFNEFKPVPTKCASRSLSIQSLNPVEIIVWNLKILLKHIRKGVGKILKGSSNCLNHW